jgi:hypothetical protein
MPIVALIFIRSGLNLVVFGVIFAVLSYLRTSRFRQRTGVNPWHIPPAVWALLSFFIALLGTVLSLIACATTDFPGRRPGQHYSGWGRPGPGYAPVPGSNPPPGYGPAPGFGPPGTSGPAPGYGSVPAPGTHPSAYPYPAAPPPPADAVGPPAWHADPTGRHHHRYWDGSHWTEHVSDNGTAAIDPV